MKTVTYMGYTYEVPDWAKYIKATNTGMVLVYDEEPGSEGCMKMYVGCLSNVNYPLEKV